MEVKIRSLALLRTKIIVSWRVLQYYKKFSNNITSEYIYWKKTAGNAYNVINDGMWKYFRPTFVS